MGWRPPNRIRMACVIWLTAAGAIAGQTRTLDIGTAQVRSGKIVVQATNYCTVIISVVGLPPRRTGEAAPSEVRNWIDSTKAIAFARPRRVAGEQLDYRWSLGSLGVTRTVNDRGDDLRLLIGSSPVPVSVVELPLLFKIVDSAAARTLEMSSNLKSCPGLENSDSASAALPNYPPTPIEMFIPPLPVPASVRGHHLRVEWDIDETGKNLSMTFNATPDLGYNKRLEQALREFRFRPGTRPDGTPVRMKAELVLDLY